MRPKIVAPLDRCLRRQPTGADRSPRALEEGVDLGEYSCPSSFAFTIETEIARPPGEVFAYITDPAKLATWQANTVSACPRAPRSDRCRDEVARGPSRPRGKGARVAGGGR